MPAPAASYYSHIGIHNKPRKIHCGNFKFFISGCSVIFYCPLEAGHKLEWINARIPLTGATVNEETRITIRQTQWPASTANRWFLDNIKIVEK